MITKDLLESYLVAIGHSHVVHLIAEADDEAILCISNTGADTLPHSDVILCLGVFPIADNSLAGLTQTREDMSILTVTMSTLVEIHEVHIHGLIRDLLVVLCVEMEQRLAENLHTLDPHLSGREGMHPADDTYALVVNVSAVHDVCHFLGAVGCTFIYHLDRQTAGVVQTFHHFLGMTINLLHCIASVKKLCTCYPPNLEIRKCFNHSF